MQRSWVVLQKAERLFAREINFSTSKCPNVSSEVPVLKFRPYHFFGSVSGGPPPGQARDWQAV